MLQTALARFRLISWIEGISFILLLGLAMPLKYLADLPIMVTIVGWIHGVLFVLFFAGLAHVAFQHRWSWKWIVGACVASVLPFGPFIFDHRMKKSNELSHHL